MPAEVAAPVPQMQESMKNDAAMNNAEYIEIGGCLVAKSQYGFKANPNIASKVATTVLKPVAKVVKGKLTNILSIYNSNFQTCGSQKIRQ